MTVAANAHSGLDDATLGIIAAEAFDVFGTGRQIQPFSVRHPGLTLDDAYKVTALLHNMRVAHGFKPLGRKIGFTNRTIWQEYNVYAPIWGYVYDRTMSDLAQPLALSPYAEPKIEPEIMFGLGKAPSSGMNAAELLACIAWVAHGFEIVQSIFPDWKFAPADTVAAYGLHGALLVGERHAVAGRAAEWLRTLSAFEVDLCREGAIMDHGRAANVLDGPLLALKHCVELLGDDPHNPQFAAGEIVSTGTLTRALPCARGETWTTALTGIALEGVKLRFA